MKRVFNFIRKIQGKLNYYLIKWRLFGFGEKWNKVNLCGGGVSVVGFCNVDLYPTADVNIDLEKKLLPFKDGSMDTLVCISAINYFKRDRGAKIIKDAYRVLKSGGVARFATQDLMLLAKKYVEKDKEFFFQKLSDGKDRFPGKTMADKMNSWFYGHKTTAGKPCRYVYDFETLASIFKEVGFSEVENKKYMESSIPEVKEMDNRPDQMFFLEAIK